MITMRKPILIKYYDVPNLVKPAKFLSVHSFWHQGLSSSPGADKDTESWRRGCSLQGHPTVWERIARVFWQGKTSSG